MNSNIISIHSKLSECDSEYMLADRICMYLAEDQISLKIQDIRSRNLVKVLLGADYITGKELFIKEQNTIRGYVLDVIDTYLQVPVIYNNSDKFNIVLSEVNTQYKDKHNEYMIIYKNSNPLFCIYNKTGYTDGNMQIYVHDIQGRFEDLCDTDYVAAQALGKATSPCVQECIDGILEYYMVKNSITNIDNVLRIFDWAQLQQTCGWLMCNYEKLKSKWFEYRVRGRLKVAKIPFEETYKEVKSVLRDYLY